MAGRQQQAPKRTVKLGGSVAITFDDGYVNNYTVAHPQLSARGLPATLFMVSDWVNGNGYVTDVQLRDMQDHGWDIGSHSKTHPNFSTLNDQQVHNEASIAKSALQAFGLDINSFALPFGALPTNLNILPQYYAHIRQSGSRINVLPFAEYVYSIWPTNVANTTVDEVLGWIADAERRGAVVILGFHRIDDDASENAWSRAKFTELLDRLNRSKVFSFKDIMKSKPPSYVRLLDKSQYRWGRGNSGTTTGGLLFDVAKGYGWDYNDRSFGIDLNTPKCLHSVKIKDVEGTVPRISKNTVDIWHSNDNVTFARYIGDFDFYHYVDSRWEDVFRSMLITLKNPPEARYWKFHQTINDVNFKTKVDVVSPFMDAWVRTKPHFN